LRTGQTTYQNYKHQTFHDTFRTRGLEPSGTLIITVDQAGQPITLTGTLSQDGRFIRGTYKAPFASGTSVMNRILEGGLPPISGTYTFAYRLPGPKAHRGSLFFLCDASGAVDGFLRLTDQDPPFSIKGVLSESRELSLSGWSKGREVHATIRLQADGTFAEGQWTWGKDGGLFHLLSQ